MLDVVELECVRGDRRLFTGLSFTLQLGELLHLHGHNGSGKTTLMRTICGLIRPSGGEVLWNGESCRKLGEEFTAELTYIGHRNGIKEDLNGIENLRLHCRLAGAPITREHAWEVLERVGLRGHEDLPARVLSQGQKRRVTLARLLLSEAPLWILDEPFTALDMAAVEFLQSIIAQHVERGGMVILTTHQQVSLTRGQVRQLRLGWKADGNV
ncbi:MAG: cytochrome c biogenesis heme-transporting ATPase CcmA [Gammaproteobacteria bacterium]|nr:cytochrome c biogenesis heme-transporting ATPase CcmA [Gammaproteobacteria bacterium]MCP5416115.1 cytochrome c biogenesis heme-transporting ATPase CcmA [Chromatiaceae bacterium]